MTGDLRLKNITSAYQGKYVEYDMGRGAITFAYNLMWTPDVAVQKAHCPAGETFPEHSHGANEWLIVYRGSIIVRMGEEEIHCKTGQHCFIPANATHSIDILETTAMIGVTVPADESYPK